MPEVDLADDSFVVAPPAKVAARLRDPGFWRTCWPNVTLTVYHDRGVEGLRWYATGSLVGTAELWLEPYREGTLVHVFLRADPARSMSSRRLTKLRHRYARALKAAMFAVRDELEAGRPAGLPGEADARTRRAVLRRTEPSQPGLAALLADVATAVAPEPVELVDVVALPGGLATAVHRLTVRRATGATQDLVLKRYLPDDDTAGSEWEGLALARRCAVPTPEPVLFDLEGRWFGTPALVMTALPGVVLTGVLVRNRRDAARWIRSLATTLVTVHRTDAVIDADGVIGDVVIDVVGGRRGDQPGRGSPREPETSVVAPRAPVSSQRLLAAWPDQWPGAYLDAARAARAEEALRRLRAEADSGWPTRCLGLCHGDFHPGDVLVDESVVTGVVDWSAAGVGPVEADVATCRADLAVVLGEDAPQEFLGVYQEVSGRELPGLAAWDVVAAATALGRVPEAAERYVELGVPIDTDTIRARLTALFDTAARQMGSASSAT